MIWTGFIIFYVEKKNQANINSTTTIVNSYAYVRTGYVLVYINRKNLEKIQLNSTIEV